MRADTTGHFESDAIKEARDQTIILATSLCTTRATTVEGLASQLEYAMRDFGDFMVGNVENDLDTKVFVNLLSGLRGLA